MPKTIVKVTDLLELIFHMRGRDNKHENKYINKKILDKNKLLYMPEEF